jgi:outer membrane biosynthesis protein TonB
MRITEFTSAADQLALVKLIFDNTWAALAKQADDQRPKATLPKAPKKAKRLAKPKIPAPPKPKPPKPITKPTVKGEPQRPQRFNTATLPKPAASVTPQNTSNTSNTTFDAFSNRNQLAKKSVDKIDDRHSSNGDTNLKKLLRIFQQVST